jgi:DNA-binding IclR family transcriptional regulator
MPGTDDSPKQTIQVIKRAIVVLHALEGEPDGLSLGRIAERVGLARSTVQRIIEALRAEQFVIAASPTSGVRLGPALIRLAASASITFDQITRPIIFALSQTIGETVDLSVLAGNMAIFTDQIQGSHRLRAVSATGETFPLYCTANGKALLSMLPPEKAARLLRGPLPRLTPNTMTRRADVVAAVALCRRTGIAVDDQEHTEGISALGAAFIDPLGRPVAISIPVPSSRFRRIRTPLGRRLLQARDSIVSALGSNSTRHGRAR